MRHRNSSIVLLAIAGCAASAAAAVTWTNPLLQVSAGTTVNQQAATQTSTTLDPFVTSVRQTAQATVGGSVVDIGSVASISCVFDPEGVSNASRLEASGANASDGAAGGTSSVLISVGVTLDSPVPYRIRSRNNDRTGNSHATLELRLRTAAGQTIFETTSPSEFERTGVLPAGSYSFFYTADLESVSGSRDRELRIDFNVQCPADLDDGSGLGRSDGAVEIYDLLYYLRAFEQGAEDADVDNGNGSGLGDGAITVDDLVYFLSRYEQGC